MEWNTLHGEKRGRRSRERGNQGAAGLLQFPSAPIQLYFSMVNAYIVTFVNGKLSEGHVDG